MSDSIRPDDSLTLQQREFVARRSLEFHSSGAGNRFRNLRKVVAAPKEEIDRAARSGTSEFHTLHSEESRIVEPIGFKNDG